MYENVLKFPRDVDHVKYFEKTPHPDKIDPGVLAILNATPKQDLNAPLLRRQLEFRSLCDYLSPNLSYLDRKVLSMPAKMQEKMDGARNEKFKTAFRHLRDTFYNFFSTPIDELIKPEVQWIDYAFATEGYTPAQAALRELRKNLFNNAALNTLENKLREAGAFRSGGKEFYFWNTDPRNWSEMSYQARSAIFESYYSILNPIPHLVPPQYIALGDFTINALPEGTVTPKGDGKYEICVNKVYFFVNDVFNFEDPGCLWLWSLPDETGNAEITPLGNSDFGAYQRHGYGANIPVLSRFYEAENFKPECWSYPRAK